MKKVTNKLFLGLLSLTLVASIASCGKKGKAPKGEKLIKEMCTGKDYMSDKDTFRATATGESLDRETAKKKARSNARAELAKTVKSTMKIVGDNYVSSNEFNNTEEVTETFNEMIRTVVDQELQGAIQICDGLTQNESGNYVFYVAMELSGQNVASAYNEKLSKDERIRAEYNYEKFKETFEEEMRKFEEGN